MAKKPGESFWKEYEDQTQQYSGPKNPRGGAKPKPPRKLPQSVPGAKPRERIMYAYDRDTQNQRFKSRKV